MRTFCQKFFLAAALLVVQIHSLAALDAALQDRSAIPVSTPAADYPAQPAGQGVEGWVLLSYWVGSDGKVRDPIIEDSSGWSAFEEAAARTVQHWTYTPAMIGGKPVAQSFNHVRMTFQPTATEPQVRPAFQRELSAVRNHIDNDRMFFARQGLSAIEAMSGRNLKEDASLWLVSYRYYQAINDQAGILSSLRRAVVFGDQFLSSNRYLHALSNLYVTEFNNQHYAQARDTLRTLGFVKGSTRVTAKFGDSSAEIQALSTSRQTIAVNAAIGPNAWWSHTPMRRDFEIDQVSGQLHVLDLRCDRGRQAFAIATQQSWRVPASWGNCRIYVRGKPGARFRLLEYPPD